MKTVGRTEVWVEDTPPPMFDVNRLGSLNESATILTPETALGVAAVGIEMAAWWVKDVTHGGGGGF